MATVSRKSPIRAKPHRQAGQSGYERIYDIVLAKMLPYYSVVVFIWLWIAWEWFTYLTDKPRQPVLLTFVAAVFTLIAVLRFMVFFREARSVKLGMEGERAVGEFLDRLRAKGYRVYHDIPDEDGQIDHVVICNRGVYTIETKTRSKPAKGPAEITYDGDGVEVDGRPSDPRPIRQALAQANKVRTLLKENTGFDYPVQPVVVYPGWYVHSLPGARSKVWVLNPKGLPKFLEHQPVCLTPDRVTLAAAQFGKYLRKHNC